MKKFFIFAIIVILFGCAGNSNKETLSKFPGERIKVNLELPDQTINRQVGVQLHRFGTKKEKAEGIKEYRMTKKIMARRGRIGVEIPPGIYDIFIDIGNKKYCLLGFRVKSGDKTIKFDKKDVINE